MLETYRKLKTKPKTIAELKQALQVIMGQPTTKTDRQDGERLLKLSD